MRAYIAAPWFTPEQDSKLQLLKTTIDSNGIEYFSPKDENLFGNDKSATVYDVLNGNINAILECDMVIAITDGKDVGTMWECGYAYAKSIPILYVWLDWQPNQKFNLMLAASGSVVYTMEELKYHLDYFKMHNKFSHLNYAGTVE